jgi:hypothetical protein
MSASRKKKSRFLGKEQSEAWRLTCRSSTRSRIGVERQQAVQSGVIKRGRAMARRRSSVGTEWPRSAFAALADGTTSIPPDRALRTHGQAEMAGL